jgi:hypothetical protein
MVDSPFNSAPNRPVNRYREKEKLATAKINLEHQAVKVMSWANFILSKTHPRQAENAPDA